MKSKKKMKEVEKNILDSGELSTRQVSLGAVDRNVPPAVRSSNHQAVPATSCGRVSVLKKRPESTPLVYVLEKCVEILRQVRGGLRGMPAVNDLMFKEEYTDAAQSKFILRNCILYICHLFLSQLLDISICVCVLCRAMEV